MQVFSYSTVFSGLLSSGFSLLGFGRLASESRSFYQCLVGFCVSASIVEVNPGNRSRCPAVLDSAELRVCLLNEALAL